MKRLIACLLATLPYIGAVAHVWDELAILARRNGDGTFTLEKDSYLAVSIYIIYFQNVATMHKVFQHQL